MNVRLFRLLVALVLCVSISSLSSATEKKEKTAKNLSWETSSSLKPQVYRDLGGEKDEAIIVEPLYNNAGADADKGGPALLLIAGVIALDIIVDTFIKVYREKSPGLFLTVCGDSLRVIENKNFPANTVIVHDCKSGMIQSFTGPELEKNPDAKVKLVKILKGKQ